MIRRLVIAWVLALPVVAAAAPPGATPPVAGGHGAAADQIKEKIRALRASMLIDELQLDEATATRLFPIFNRYDNEMEHLLQQRADLQRQLRNAGGMRDPRAVNQLIDDAVANQHAMADAKDRSLADLRKVLTPTQAARLVVVLPEFERKIQNQLRRAIRQQRNRNHRPGARNRDLEDDDDDEGGDDAPAGPRR